MAVFHKQELQASKKTKLVKKLTFAIIFLGIAIAMFLAFGNSLFPSLTSSGNSTPAPSGVRISQTQLDMKTPFGMPEGKTVYVPGEPDSTKSFIKLATGYDVEVSEEWKNLNRNSNYIAEIVDQQLIDAAKDATQVNLKAHENDGVSSQGVRKTSSGETETFDSQPTVDLSKIDEVTALYSDISIDQLIPMPYTITSTYTLVDVDPKDKSMTIDKFWQDRMAAAELVVGQYSGSVPVYAASEDAEYFIAITDANIFNGKAHQTPLDWMFAMDNTYGQTLNDCFYDPERGIAFIPRSAFEEQYEKTSHIQQQFLVPYSLENETDSTIPVDIYCDDNVVAPVAKQYTIKHSSLDTDFTIPVIDPSSAADFTLDNFRVAINGCMIDLSVGQNASYDEKLGTLTFKEDPIAVSDVSVYVLPSESTTIGLDNKAYADALYSHNPADWTAAGHLSNWSKSDHPENSHFFYDAVCRYGRVNEVNESWVDCPSWLWSIPDCDAGANGLADAIYHGNWDAVYAHLENWDRGRSEYQFGTEPQPSAYFIGCAPPAELQMDPNQLAAGKYLTLACAHSSAAGAGDLDAAGVDFVQSVLCKTLKYGDNWVLFGFVTPNVGQAGVGMVKFTFDDKGWVPIRKQSWHRIDTYGTPYANDMTATFACSTSPSMEPVVQTIQTDANGDGKFENLDPGTYYFKEIVPPPGFPQDNTVLEWTINAGRNAYLTNMMKDPANSWSDPSDTWINTASTTIIAPKIDGDTGKGIKDVEFGVWRSQAGAEAKRNMNLGEFEGEFYITPVRARSYAIQPEGGSTASHAIASLGLANHSDIQKWKFEQAPGSDGYYYIVNVQTGMVFDTDGHTDPGTEVWMYNRAVSDTQKWKIQKDEHGYYFVNPFGLILDLKGNVYAEGTHLEYWNNTGGEGMYWQLVRVDNDFVGTMTTGDDGVAKMTKLPLGDYYIRELSVPANSGYTLINDVFKIEAHTVGGDHGPNTDSGKIPNYKPNISTLLASSNGSKNLTTNGEPITLVDTVTYKNLTPGVEYKLTGKLIDKSTRQELPGVTSDGKTFTPSSANGTETVSFRIPALAITKSTTLVCYQTLSKGSEEVAKHEDINDTDQTVNIDSPNPSIQTTLTTSDNKKNFEFNGTTVTLKDTVTYKNLTSGTEYKLSGKLMDKSTGQVFPGVTSDGKTFTPSSANGTEIVTFTIPASAITKSTTLVCYETLFKGSDEVTKHENINDDGQTVNIDYPNPSIQTSLTTTDNKKNFEFNGTTVTLKDTVTYKNLIPDTEYKLEGTLIDKSTGQPFPGVTSDGKTFTPSSANGTEIVTFTIPASAITKNTTLVCYEKLFKGNDEATKHEDINATDQTVSISYPEITSMFESNGAKEVTIAANGTVTLTDTVTYSGLDSDTTYTLVSTLMNKQTQAQFNASGVQSSKETTFKPTNANGSGTVQVSFTVPASAIQYNEVTLVAYQSVKLDNDVVALHEDLNDGKQTIKIKPPTPTVGTVFATVEGKYKEIYASDGVVSLVDTVSYDNLIPNVEYTLKATLKDKATSQTVAGTTETEKKFTPTSAKGTVDVPISLNASSLAGHSVVAFEKLLIGNKEIATHEDINDTDQTVYIPKISTSVLAPNGLRVMQPKGSVELTDTVTYENLVVGHKYTVSGTLMDKATGKAVPGVNEVTASFTAQTTNGTVPVKFTVNASAIANKTVVVFETLKIDDKTIADHKNINDAKQTIDFIDIGTTAIDRETGTHEQLADGTATVDDEVAYTNLTPGKKYKLNGTLYDKATGQALEAANGDPITGETEFTPTERNGKAVVTFTVPNSLLEGKTYVVYESLYLDGREIATHSDITDEGQTIYVPKARTTATNTETKTSTAQAVEQASIDDVVEYNNLKPGKEYELSGYLVNKETGEKIEGTDKTINFTPEKADGTVTVTFTFDASKLAGKTIVAFETVSYNKKPVAVHMDINDKKQSIDIVDIKTTAVEKETGFDEFQVGSTVVITDTVAYENLVPETKYTMQGKLVGKSAPETALATASTEFTPKERNGSVVLEFEIDTSKIKDLDLVAFEELLLDSTIIAVHADVNDEDQTVHLIDIGTTAIDKVTGLNEVLASETSTIVDTVNYSNLTPGKEYKVSGVLMDKETEKALEIDGQTVESSTTFTPEKRDGSVEVTFEIPSKLLVGKTFVAFEELYREDKKIAVHTDIKDEDQTVYIPYIETTALDGDTHEQLASEKATITDKVDYHNLIVGKTYTVTGTLMIKGENPPKAVEIDGKPLSVSKTFTAEESDGYVEITFEFDSSALAGQSLVAFEKVYRDDILVAVHEDIEDSNQTVNIPNIRTIAVNEQGGKEIHSAMNVKVKDIIKYSNLTIGETYTVMGTLMVKSPEPKALVISGDQPVSTQTTFVPTSCDGEVEVVFEFDASKLKDITLVAYEKILNKDKLVAVHEDINDADQSVFIPADDLPFLDLTYTGDNTGLLVILILLTFCTAGIIGIRRKSRDH